MKRVWSEYLSYEDARAKKVLDYLIHYELHPLFAVRPESDRDALVALLRDVQQRGLKVGIWPLLSDAEGYWPCERNVGVFLEQLRNTVNAIVSEGVRIDWVAIDLEPPLEQIVRAKQSPLKAIGVLSELFQHNLDLEQFQESTRQFGEGQRWLKAQGIQTLAVAFPMVASDLKDQKPLWQDLLESPWAVVPWDRAGIMAYSSLIAGYSRGLVDAHDLRALHYRLLVRMHSSFGEGAHVSLGVTGTGKLGDEPIYRTAGELESDVAVARGAGIEDIGVFCLEGLLGRSDSGAWAEALSTDRIYRPTQLTPRAKVLKSLGQLARWSLQKAQ